MKKNTIKSTTFKAESVAGKSEVKKASVNIFFLRNELRALARKNEFCDSKSVAKVAKAVRNYTNGGSLFDLDAFEIDSKGRYCTVSRSAKCPSFGKDIASVTPEGWNYLQPITLTLNGVFAAFCKVAAKEIKALEAAEYKQLCEEEKAAKAAKRARESKIKTLNKALTKGVLTQEEYNAKVAAL